MMLMIPVAVSATKLTKMTKASSQTRMEVFPVFLTAFPMIVIPAAVPMIE